MTQHWKNLEELKGLSPHQQEPGKEFPKPPAKQELTAMERRTFLKLMGATAIAASISCSRRPVEKLIPYVNKPEEITPGVANWYASTCGECSASCGTLIKTREGRPIKIEGNPEHPLSQGGLCARGQASLLNLYNPDRIRKPSVINRATGKLETSSWELLDETIRIQLQQIKYHGKKVAVLTGAITSPSTKSVIADFLAQFRNGEHVAFETVVPEEIALGQEGSYGKRITPRYRFDRAEMIVSFGADFLGTWLSPVEFAKQFSHARNVDEGRMAKLVVVESALSLTGTNADEYLGVTAGTELFAALAIAHELIINERQTLYASNSAVVSALEPYSAEKVEASVGINAKALRKLALELWKHRGKGLILGGQVKGEHAVTLQNVVDLLNSALGNDGNTIDTTLPSLQAQSSYDSLVRLVDEMKKGRIAALFLGDGDLAFTLPRELEFEKALESVPLIVSLSDQWNATTKLATHVAPGTHALESWNDAMPQEGLISIIQPAIRPLYENRSMQDSLIRWGASNHASFYDSLREKWKRYGDWEAALQRGFIDLAAHERAFAKGSSARLFRVSPLSPFPRLPQQEGGLKLSLVPSIAMYDGRFIANGWLRELPDPVSKVTWENVASIAPKTAHKLGVQEGDVVRLEGDGAAITIPVHLQPKLATHTISIPFGYGETQDNHLGNEHGVNVAPLQRVAPQLPIWSGMAIRVIKTGKRVKLASTQGHHSIEQRPILFETTWEEFQRDPHAGIEAHESDLTMWPKHKYEKERWGMVIDTNACIGCSGCVIGCQAENNIPVVGKDQVIKGREMHWLRIDRYFSGNEENPDVTNQPMLCQQCENAPCETVCPTLATFHSDDGLNMMTYNRCVGTRYCSNNCPYKVRRFNYYPYAEKFEEPINLVLNPDVTVRSRGVMEKCTFCVQRIQEKRIKADSEGRKLADGEIKTACQQSCPANAIIFGDLNDPSSEVSKHTKKERGYRSLAELNTRPAVTYLTKVRNKEV